jgi:alpha-tubulin suppressor-like RCC1 family protein
MSSTGSPWTAIGVGHGQTCALAANGELDCWGQVLDNPLKAAPAIAEKPIRIGGDGVFVAFAAGGHHDCAIDANGVGFCWGSNNRGQAAGR